MTGSMYAAIAGLQTHMQKMNVIGNNIANANTVGFKPGVTVFSESLYTAINNSTAGGNQYGGTNAAQIGYGSQLGTIDLNMTTGSYQPTGVNSHLYLNGNGFFLTGPKPDDAVGYQPDPNDLELTRVGKFSLDNDGFLVDANGHCVYGFMPKGDPTTGKLTDPIQWDGCLRPLRIPVAAPPKQDPTDTTMPDEGDAVYPTVGAGNQGQGDNELQYPPALGNDFDKNNRVDLQGINLSVDSNGVIVGTTQGGQTVTVGAIAVGSVINPNGLTKQNNGYYRAGGNAGDVTVGTCGQIVSGPNGENIYLNNDEADAANAVAITGTGTTTIMSGGLESSKTDVATEFADLITTQRGFQANTKIITVTDEMLSDLVNMKR